MVSKPDPHQLYSLTWSEFGSSLISSVQLFRGGNDLVDVTLAAGGRTFPAHKIVLSAASSFLRNILKSTPCKHPVVLLAGIASDDLESLLEFVYRGEVSVPPSQLQSLLQAAQCLSIQGLIPSTQVDASSQKFEVEQPPEVVSQPVTSAALARDVINSFLPIRRRKRAKRRDSAGSGSKHARTDSENHNGSQNMQAGSSSDSLVDGHKADDHDIDQNAEEQADVGSPKSRGASDQPGVCPVCGATLRQARNLRRHLLTSCKLRSADLGSRVLTQAFPDASEHIVCPVSPNIPSTPANLDPDTVELMSHAHYLQVQNLSASYSQTPEQIEVRVSPPVSTTPTMCENEACFLP